MSLFFRLSFNRSFFAALVSLFATGVPAAEVIELGLNWKPEPQFGGFYEAQRAGFFKEQGLEVKILEGGSGTPTVQMLDSKKINFAVVSADEIVLSHERGAKEVVALFATYQTNPQGIMLHKDSPVADLKTLFSSGDNTLLWQSGLPYALFLKKKYGPLKIKAAPYSGGIGLFSQDKKIAQQCFITSEPLLAEKSGLSVKTLLVADSGFNPYTTVLATNQAFLKQNPALVKKVVIAVRKGWENYLKDSSKANQSMHDLNKTMDLETFKKSADAQKKLIEVSDPKRKLGEMNLARWQELVRQLLSVNAIKKTVEAKSLFENIQ